MSKLRVVAMYHLLCFFIVSCPNCEISLNKNQTNVDHQIDSYANITAPLPFRSNVMKKDVTNYVSTLKGLCASVLATKTVHKHKTATNTVSELTRISAVSQAKFRESEIDYDIRYLSVKLCEYIVSVRPVAN